MKKKRDHYLSRTLASASAWALGFFAVFGLALYTYAITYPDTQPNPVSGVVGLFVGSTPAMYNPNNGYETVNSFCSDAYEYSHVCTSMEMINTYNHNPEALGKETESLWINSGLPGNPENLNNDCRGWTSVSNEEFASVWNPTKKQGFLASCDMIRKYACCK